MHLDELAARELFKMQYSAMSIVSTLDRELRFDKSQREMLLQDMADHWDEAWEDLPSVLAIQSRALPDSLQTIVLAHLTPDQAVVWRTAGNRVAPRRARRMVIQNREVMHGPRQLHAIRADERIPQTNLGRP